MSHRKLISESSLEKALAYYYSLEEKELFGLTNDFAKEQEFLISYIAGYQKDMQESLFEELLDASIIIWLSFKNELKEIPVVHPEIVEKLEKKNEKMIRKLSAKLKMDEEETVKKVNEINILLGDAKNGEDFQEIISNNENQEIVDFINMIQHSTEQNILNDYITDEVPFHLEEENYTDEEIQTVVEMLVFQMECYDMLVNG